MSITAKKVDNTGVVTNIVLGDDPADIDIVQILGGTPSTLVTMLVEDGDWEIHKLPNNNSNYLVIGSAPAIHSVIKKRKDAADLTDDQVHQILKNNSISFT